MTEAEIQQTIEWLREVDASDVAPVEHVLTPSIVSWATEYLTTGPDVDFYRKKLQEGGYRVHPGEVDRFGWLTAYFSLRKGIILFG